MRSFQLTQRGRLLPKQKSFKSEFRVKQEPYCTDRLFLIILMQKKPLFTSFCFLEKYYQAGSKPGIFFDYLGGTSMTLWTEMALMTNMSTWT